jgi:cytochrome c biogenesis protein ResB
MDEGVAIFVTIMTAMVLVAALLHSWMRTRGQVKVAAGGLEATRQVELLSNENAGLKGQIGRLEERIAVLERIATDPSDRTAREIDQLR